MSKFTRTDLLKVFTAYGVGYEKARQITGAVIEALTVALSSGNVIELRGFGSFEQRVRKARTKHNPQTMKQIYVPARRSIFFRPGKELKNKLKGETEL